MTALENVKGAATDPRTVATVMTLGRKIGKVIVYSQNICLLWHVNARRQHPQSGTEMDTTWKKEARTAKDDVATDSDGRAERDGVVMG